MATNGGWNEKADTDNGVPESYDADSPYGYCAWVVVGILALADVAFIVLIAIGKVNVKERKEPEEEY